MIVFLNEETELGAMTDSDVGDMVSNEDMFSSSSSSSFWLASVMPTNFGQAFSRKSSECRDGRSKVYKNI